MKLDVEVNEITLGNTGPSGEFKIRNSAKAFKILSDGLYSNKKRAIIRELSCNALDSHVAAGKADVPFEVHLPTVLEPWFAVRDFGTGLTSEQVMSIYTTYFESTKTDSNDFIGALGLGSKSPFSYTENFTVTAIKDGSRHIYSAYINEMGVPCVTEMSSDTTDESNGVEVKFSVTNRSDYDSFRYEAAEVFKWFKNLPTITGAAVTIQPVNCIEKNIVPGVHTSSHSSTALMGNIAYPMNKIPEPEKHFGDLALLLRCNLIIEFGIGELDFAASREELSYVPLTLNSIKKKLEELNKNLLSHFSAKANAITNEWERAEFLYKETRNDLYRSAVKKYVVDNNFKLYDTSTYQGIKQFRFTTTDLAAKGLSFSGVRIRPGGQTSVLRPTNEYINGKYHDCTTINVDTSVVIVLNDLKTGCLSRAKYHYSATSNDYKSVYCLSHNSDDLTVRQAAYDALLAEMHNPPVVLKASELSVKKKEKTMTKQGIMVFKPKAPRGYYNSSTREYVWKPAEEEFDSKITYYYIELNNYDALDLNGNTYPIMSLRHRMDESGIPELTNTVIYGVRKSKIKEVSKLSNWVHITERLKKVASKISIEEVREIISAKLFDYNTALVYNNQNVAALLDSKSDYAVFTKKLKSNKRVSTNDSVKLSSLAGICSEFGNKIEFANIQSELESEKDKLSDKYPLLNYLRYAHDTEIAEYITMVDKCKVTVNT